MDIFQRMNTFVSLTHEHSRENRLRDHGLQTFGVAVLAENNGADRFPGISMHIDFVVGIQCRVPWEGNLGKRAVSVFLIEDRHAVCAYLQRKVNQCAHHGAYHKIAPYVHYAYSDVVHIHISISSHIGAVSTLLENGFPRPDSKLSMCLDHLTRMRGLKHVEINGPVTSQYRSATIAAMCDQPLHGTATMKLIESQMDQGDDASIKYHWDSAVLAYKTALHTICGSYYYPDGSDDVILVGGRFQGQQVSRYVSSVPPYLNLSILRL